MNQLFNQENLYIVWWVSTVIIASIFTFFQIRKHNTIIKDFDKQIKKQKFSGQLLNSLVNYFNVGLPSTSTSNAIGGFLCDKCKKTFSLDISHGCSTVVCPHCFDTTSSFIKPK